jgi:hypothetical protein
MDSLFAPLRIQKARLAGLTMSIVRVVVLRLEDHVIVRGSDKRRKMRRRTRGVRGLGRLGEREVCGRFLSAIKVSVSCVDPRGIVTHTLRCMPLAQELYEWLSLCPKGSCHLHCATCASGRPKIGIVLFLYNFRIRAVL